MISKTLRCPVCGGDRLWILSHEVFLRTAKESDVHVRVSCSGLVSVDRETSNRPSPNDHPNCARIGLMCGDCQKETSAVLVTAGDDSGVSVSFDSPT
jgi:hypothetical protein